MSDHRDLPPPTKKTAWWQLWRKLKARRLGAGLSSNSQNFSGTTAQDWLEVLDKLQPLVRQMRNEIDELQSSKISFDILGAGTFLLQVDLLLIKIRQHFNNIQRRKVELNLSIPQVRSIMKNVEENAKACCAHMAQLHAVMNQLNYAELNNPNVLSVVQQLEDSTKALSHCMQGLNEIALKRDPVYQLFENELFKTLMELEQGQSLNIGQSSTSSTTAPLRDKAHHIEDSEFRKIAYNIISYYDTLKRCSILYQSSQVTECLEAFKNHIELFLSHAQNANQNLEPMTHGLHGLYADLEAMRFIRFKGFQDKAKSIKKQMTTMLKSSEFGRECLKNLQMSPKSKLTLKSRFKS